MLKFQDNRTDKANRNVRLVAWREDQGFADCMDIVQVHACRPSVLREWKAEMRRRNPTATRLEIVNY